MKTRDMGFEIGLAIREALKGHRAFSASPLGDWGDLVGEQVGRNSLPVSLKKGILKVVAYDSVWKHHLELNKEALIQKINHKRPEPIVQKIIIKVGELPETPPVLNKASTLVESLEAKRSRPKKKKKVPLRPLTPKEKELLESLPDPDLRAMGERLLRRLPLEEKEPA